MAQSVFDRIEKKYLMDEEKFNQMLEALKPYMEIDAYGLHNIRNIYFDTDTDELIRTSLEQPVYKEKFRIRCYGQPTEETDIFMEIKKKYKGVTNKRRIGVKNQELTDYLERGIIPERIAAKNPSGQIFREIDYMIKRYGLQPKLYLAYDRIALFGKEDSGFRVTFDQNIRSRRENLTLFCDENTTLLMNEKKYLMEVKAAGAMPLWFVQILSELEIQKVSFSKYGNIYRKEVAEGMHDYRGLTGKESVDENNSDMIPEGIVA
jgi:SPX domain protein involved in polyphosphate accumulation